MTTHNHITSVTNESIAKRTLEKIVLDVADKMKVDWAEPSDLYWFSEKEAKALAPDLMHSAAKAGDMTPVPDDLARLINQYEDECAQAAIDDMLPKQLEKLRQPVRVSLAEYAEKDKD